MHTYKIDELKTFLKMLCLEGQIGNDEALVCFKDKSISSMTVSGNKSVATNGVMEGEAYEAIGEVGVDNLKLLNGYISNLGEGEIQMEKKENKLVFKAKKSKFSSVLRNPTYIINNLDNAKFNSIKEKGVGNLFLVKNEVLKDIVKNFKILNSNVLYLKGKDKTLTLELENNQNTLHIDYDVEIKNEFNIKIASHFINLIGCIDCDVEMSAKTGCPLYVKAKNKNCTFEYLIALVK